MQYVLLRRKTVGDVDQQEEIETFLQLTTKVWRKLLTKTVPKLVPESKTLTIDLSSLATLDTYGFNIERALLLERFVSIMAGHTINTNQLIITGVSPPEADKLLVGLSWGDSNRTLKHRVRGF